MARTYSKNSVYSTLRKINYASILIRLCVCVLKNRISNIFVLHVHAKTKFELQIMTFQTFLTQTYVVYKRVFMLTTSIKHWWRKLEKKSIPTTIIYLIFISFDFDNNFWSFKLFFIKGSKKWKSSLIDTNCNEICQWPIAENLRN